MKRLLAYIHHLIEARSIYGVHSPFVFEWYKEVLRHHPSAAGNRIEQLRRRLCQSAERLEIVDLGAGAGGNLQAKRKLTIAEAAKRSARHRREGEFLFRLCDFVKPQRCLEFGTNLGISALYQLAALPKGVQFISMEGDPGLAHLASEHIREMGFEAEILVGDFDNLLNEVLDLAAYRPDYVFLDGNHRYEPTIAYFHRLLPHMEPGGLIVLDDISWSTGMARAWSEIVAHPEVSVSIDLFWMGLVFIRRNQEKEHFRFRFRNR